MQESLYPLNSKDVEAIGRSRVNRTLSQNMKIWMWASMIVCISGIVYGYNASVMVGTVVMILGCISFFLYGSAVDKKRKAMARRLMREWREEKGEEVEK